MTHQTLASCLIIPQHLSIAIDGGVHLDETLARYRNRAVDYDPQEALRHWGRPFGTAPLASHPNIARHQNHIFSGNRA